MKENKSDADGIRKKIQAINGESFKFCVNSKSDIRYVNSFKWAEPIFSGSALVCIIQGFLLLSMYQS